MLRKVKLWTGLEKDAPCPIENVTPDVSAKKFRKTRSVPSPPSRVS
jgi:hypothetical protein